MDKSHLSDPKRLGILMITACLADLWMAYPGLVAIRKETVWAIHRARRCGWSLFRLGLVLLDLFCNEDLPIPVSFTKLELKIVR